MGDKNITLEHLTLNFHSVPRTVYTKISQAKLFIFTFKHNTKLSKAFFASHNGTKSSVVSCCLPALPPLQGNFFQMPLPFPYGVKCPILISTTDVKFPPPPRGTSTSQMPVVCLGRCFYLIDTLQHVYVYVYYFK